MSSVQKINISTSSIIRIILVVLAVFFIYQILDILTALFFAIIIASALEPAVEWLHRYKVPRIVSVVMVYIAVGMLFLLTTYLVFPLVIEEFQSFIEQYPSIQEQVITRIEHHTDVIPFSSYVLENIKDFLSVPSKYISLDLIQGNLLDIASAVFGGVSSFLLVVIFSLYLVAQKNGIENFFRLITPLDYEDYVLDLWKRSQRKLGRWLRTQVLLAAVIGILIFFGLSMLKVKNAFLFALLAALLEIIPIIGPIIAAIPAVLITSLQSLTYGLSVAGMYIIVQWLESNVIIPVVMRSTVGLSPLVVILALVIGAKFGGLLGVVLSVPLTAVLAELVNDWDKKKREILPQ